MSVRVYSVASSVKLLDMNWFLRLRLVDFLARLRCSAPAMAHLVGGSFRVTGIRGHNVVKTWSGESAKVEPCVRFPVQSWDRLPGNHLKVLEATAIKRSRAPFLKAIARESNIEWLAIVQA